MRNIIYIMKASYNPKDTFDITFARLKISNGPGKQFHILSQKNRLKSAAKFPSILFKAASSSGGLELNPLQNVWPKGRSWKRQMK